MAKICGIYKITNPNGAVYIGQSRNIQYRFISYKGLRCKTQTRIYNSLNKYGVESHVFEVLQECCDNELNELEIYYIKLFDSFNTKHGMNLRSGGAHGSPSDETKKKLSDALNGHTHSEETKEKMRGRVVSDENKKRMSDVHKGRKLSDEHKKKLSEANKGMVVSDEARINLSKALKERWMNPEFREKTIAMLKQRRLSEEHKKRLRERNLGSKRTEEEKRRRSEAMMGNKHAPQRALLEYNTNGELVREWESMTDASVYHAVSVTTISRHAKAGTYTRKGTTFIFK